MAYSDKVWKNAPDYTTPLSAAGLNDWEARIKAETDALSVLADTKVAGVNVDGGDTPSGVGFELIRDGADVTLKLNGVEL